MFFLIHWFSSGFCTGKEVFCLIVWCCLLFWCIFDKFFWFILFTISHCSYSIRKCFCFGLSYMCVCVIMIEFVNFFLLLVWKSFGIVICIKKIVWVWLNCLVSFMYVIVLLSDPLKSWLRFFCNEMVYWVWSRGIFLTEWLWLSIFFISPFLWYVVVMFS